MGGKEKYRLFSMSSNLRDYKLKIIRLLLFINLMVTTTKTYNRHKDTKIKESKHNTKDSHQFTREESKVRRKELGRRGEAARGKEVLWSVEFWSWELVGSWFPGWRACPNSCGGSPESKPLD